MTIDVLFLAHNRLEFTKASLKALMEGTDWDLVDRLVVYDDNSTDGTLEFLTEAMAEFPKSDFRPGKWGGPVDVMIDFLKRQNPTDGGSHIFAKVDSDFIVYPGWLTEAMVVMDKNPTLDLLGLEVMYSFCGGACERGYEDARYIGGVGLMRSGSFITLPRPHGRFGFTSWQEQSPNVKKGWMNPAMPCFLLNRLPVQPWASLSSEYIHQGWQRESPLYPEAHSQLWSWWQP